MMRRVQVFDVNETLLDLAADANSKAMAAVKSAPLRKIGRASATAVYEHDDEAAPEAAGDGERPRRVVGEQAHHLPLGHHRLHQPDRRNPSTSGPQDLPGHPNGDAQGVGDPSEDARDVEVESEVIPTSAPRFR
jgi:hypothetical protein